MIGPEGGIPTSHGALSIGVKMTKRLASFGRRVHRGQPRYLDADLLVHRSVDFEVGPTCLTVSSPNLPLPHGRFSVWVGVFDRSGREYLWWRPAISFDVFGPALDPAPVGVLRLAPVQVAAEWGLSTDGRDPAGQGRGPDA